MPKCGGGRRTASRGGTRGGEREGRGALAPGAHPERRGGVGEARGGRTAVNRRQRPPAGDGEDGVEAASYGTFGSIPPRRRGSGGRRSSLDPRRGSGMALAATASGGRSQLGFGLGKVTESRVCACEEARRRRGTALPPWSTSTEDGGQDVALATAAAPRSCFGCRHGRRQKEISPKTPSVF